MISSLYSLPFDEANHNKLKKDFLKKYSISSDEFYNKIDLSLPSHREITEVFDTGKLIISLMKPKDIGGQWYSLIQITDKDKLDLSLRNPFKCK